MRIMVTGSRTWKDFNALNYGLAEVWHRLGDPVDPLLVHGGALGVDRMSRDIWESRGWTCEEYKADWQGLGKKAGFVRNDEMLRSGIDHIVAFMDGPTPGTCDAFSKSYALGIPSSLYELNDGQSTRVDCSNRAQFDKWKASKN